LIELKKLTPEYSLSLMLSFTGAGWHLFCFPPTLFSLHMLLPQKGCQPAPPGPNRNPGTLHFNFSLILFHELFRWKRKVRSLSAGMSSRLKNRLNFTSVASSITTAFPVAKPI
jgi:hypothetical protein